jgi:prolyl oligopeptidase
MAGIRLIHQSHELIGMEIEFSRRLEPTFIERIHLGGAHVPGFGAGVEFVHLYAIRGVVLSLDTNRIGFDAQVRVLTDQYDFLFACVQQFAGASQNLIIRLVLIGAEDPQIQVVRGHIDLERAAVLQGDALVQTTLGAQSIQQAGHGARIATNLRLILFEMVHFLNHDDGNHHIVFLEMEDGIGIVEQDIRVQNEDLLAAGNQSVSSKRVCGRLTPLFKNCTGKPHDAMVEWSRQPLEDMMKLASLALALSLPLTAQVTMKYPETHKSNVVDDYFGTKVADPYRWLEDDNSAETKAWVQAQNKVTFAYLETIPERKIFRDRMTKLWNIEKYTAPFKAGKRYFYSYNSGLQNQFVLYVTDDPKSKGKVLLDPNTLSKDGTVALSGMNISDDGKRMAYSVSVAGSDWQTWKVRDIDTGKDLDDEIRWSKASGASWRKDGSGFYYSRYAEPKGSDALTGVNQNHKIYFHALGTSQDKDLLVFERPDQPEWYLGANVSEDGRWLVISAGKGTNPESSLFLQDLHKPGGKVEPFLDKMDATYTVIDTEGDLFFVLTNQGAPRNRLVAIRRGETNPKTWKEIIPEHKGKDVLDEVHLVGERFVATWMRDAYSAVELFDLSGRKLSEIQLPTLGTTTGFGGKRKDTETFFSFNSFTYPGTTYRLDLKTNKSLVLHETKVDFNPADFEVKQVFYPSKDGTKIPMFIIHKKGLKLDGTNPTLLYGYGGFNVSNLPGFSVSRLVWMEMGGVFAMANLRGGGEYGLAWYDAGRLKNKQNVFDDFIAAAEWLISNKYTSTPRLAINGGSNGGLLVGACLTQRPDLFGAAVPEVGVMDMLRFHKFTLGWGWKSDYGSSETKDGFDTLIKYSPLHTIKSRVKYPATLVTTGDHDDRVVPAHSHKFTATLQAAQAGPAPILTRIETSAGHGAGKPTAKVIEERADVFAFLVKNLGMKPFQK